MSDIDKIDVERGALPKGEQQYAWGALDAPKGPQPLSADMKAVNSNTPIEQKKAPPFEGGAYD
jgi:hypothetical protein